MDVLKFSAYKIRDLQNCMQLLTQCEAAGITDSRFVREALNKYLYRPQSGRARGRKRKHIMAKGCQSCNAGVLVGPYKVDGLVIVRCSKKCGYSEVVG